MEMTLLKKKHDQIQALFGNDIVMFLSSIDSVYVPGTQMISIFEGQPPQNKAFSHQNKGHLGSRYVYIYINKSS